MSCLGIFWFADKQTIWKISFVLDLIEQINIVPSKYFKKLKGTDNILEIRVQQGNNIFRILGFFDGKELVVLNHAFIKKSQKIPQKEIAVAEKRKRNYFKQKDLKWAISKNIRKNAWNRILNFGPDTMSGLRRLNWASF